MSWHKITLPIPPMKEIDPKVVEIGDLARERWEQENKPAGFGMLHASRGTSDPLEQDARINYRPPVASELCGEELREKYPVGLWAAPARGEPGIMWVLGDPLVMGMLKDKGE